MAVSAEAAIKVLELLEVGPKDHDAVASRLARVEFQKGWQFVVAGARTSHIGLVVQGMFKFYKIRPDGQIYIQTFAPEWAFVSDYSAIIQDQPANVTIEAMEDGRLFSLSFADYQDFLARGLLRQDVARRIIERENTALVRRIHELLMLSARERLHAFQEEYRPHLSRIARNEVAAYIAITPTSLSRLSAQLQREARGR